MSQKKSVPYETAREVKDACLCLHLQRGARAIARRFDEAFRPLELTHGQFSLMMALNQPEPPSLTRIADLLGMDRTSLTAKLKPLERRGLVLSLASSSDRRNRLLKLTPNGDALLADGLRLWRKTHAELDATLSPKDQKRLRADLNALSAGD